MCGLRAPGRVPDDRYRARLTPSEHVRVLDRPPGGAQPAAGHAAIVDNPLVTFSLPTSRRVFATLFGVNVVFTLGWLICLQLVGG